MYSVFKKLEDGELMHVASREEFEQANSVRRANCRRSGAANMSCGIRKATMWRCRDSMMHYCSLLGKAGIPVGAITKRANPDCTPAFRFRMGRLFLKAWAGRRRGHEVTNACDAGHGISSGVPARSRLNLWGWLMSMQKRRLLIVTNDENESACSRTWQSRWGMT